MENIIPCPFCGAKVEEYPNVNTGKEYLIIRHKEGCYYLINNSAGYTLLSKEKICLKAWNKRYDKTRFVR